MPTDALPASVDFRGRRGLHTDGRDAGLVSVARVEKMSFRYLELPAGLSCFGQFWQVLMHFSSKLTQNTRPDPAGSPFSWSFSTREASPLDRHCAAHGSADPCMRRPRRGILLYRSGLTMRTGARAMPRPLQAPCHLASMLGLGFKRRPFPKVHA